MLELIINLVLLLIIGFVIGTERERKHKVIGIRSTSLVLLGSFIFTYISTLIGGDPARIIAQIVTGVGFIGAGIIFKHGMYDIKNLTTAVLVWTLSAVGCLIALSFRIEAIVITAVILLILHSSKFLTNKSKKNEKE